MKKNTTLSTVIDAKVKEAAVQFCEQRGLKLQYLVEQALVEQLEDAIDLEAYHARRHEETTPLHKILKGRQKKSK